MKVTGSEAIAPGRTRAYDYTQADDAQNNDPTNWLWKRRLWRGGVQQWHRELQARAQPSGGYEAALGFILQPTPNLKVNLKPS